MCEQNPILDDEVKEVFDNFPIQIREHLLNLREIIFTTASNCELIKELDETLKWGEPSYISKIGSTIRLGKVKSNQNQYAIYFNCKSKLVDTFKELYGDIFTYETNRAILFNVKDEVPYEEVQHCILMALTYHKIKNKPAMSI